MKLGRIPQPSQDGDTARLVAVDPDGNRVIDLRRANGLALEGRGATAAAAGRLAAAVFPADLAT